MKARPVLVAPDKFKGTLSAAEVAAAIGRGLVSGGLDSVEPLPVADGGEGTMECLVRALRGTYAPLEVSDPLGRRVEKREAQTLHDVPQRQEAPLLPALTVRGERLTDHRLRRW